MLNSDTCSLHNRLAGEYLRIDLNSICQVIFNSFRYAFNYSARCALVLALSPHIPYPVTCALPDQEAQAPHVLPPEAARRLPQNQSGQQRHQLTQRGGAQLGGLCFGTAAQGVQQAISLVENAQCTVKLPDFGDDSSSRARPEAWIAASCAPAPASSAKARSNPVGRSPVHLAARPLIGVPSVLPIMQIVQ